MQRKATNKTRGPTAEEIRFGKITKDCDCIVCGSPGPSIVDHCRGSTFRNLKTLIGHWFILPLCPVCDKWHTKGSVRRFENESGNQQAVWWSIHIIKNSVVVPDDVLMAIEDLIY